MAFDGSEVNLLIAFLGGTITFFASCLLPLVPTYLAYLSGIPLKEGVKNTKSRDRILVNSVAFSLGFICVFVLLGAGASSIGILFATQRVFLQRLGGAFFIILGVFMLGIIKPGILMKERKIKLPKNLSKWRKLNSFLVGMFFGFAWTPCVGPVLAVILFWASQTNTVLQGTTLLFVYGLGLGLPFVLIGLLFDRLLPVLSESQKFGAVLNKIAGLIILVTGILLLVGRLDILTTSLLNLLNIRSHSV